jgi:hypothetical protein
MFSAKYSTFSNFFARNSILNTLVIAIATIEEKPRPEKQLRERKLKKIG